MAIIPTTASTFHTTDILYHVEEATEDCQDPQLPNSPIWEKGHPRLRVDTKGRRVARELAQGFKGEKESTHETGLLKFDGWGSQLLLSTANLSPWKRDGTVEQEKMSSQA
ncbi:hypothetical protein Dimus_028569 [Dionaea muscipula]